MKTTKLLTILIMFCFYGAKVKAQNTIPRDSLVAYYPFNDDFNDKSGNNYNGRAGGAKLIGTKNKACFFDGIDDSISIPGIEQLRDAKQFTISCWINPYFFKPWDTWISKTKVGSNVPQWSLSFVENPENKIQFVVHNRGWNDYNFNYKIDLQKWHHVLYLVDNQNHKVEINIDGIKVGSLDICEILPSIGTLYIGFQKFDMNYFFGMIDEVIIYNRLLKDSEISTLYTHFSNTEKAEAKKPPLVTYIANEGFLLENGGKKVLVDALYDQASAKFLVPAPELMQQIIAGQPPFADVDLLLVTHPHADHLAPKLAVEFLRQHPKCRLIAHTQTINTMRSLEGFSSIQAQIQELTLEPGSWRRLSSNGIELDAIGLDHKYTDERPNQKIDIAFNVRLGGVQFLHLGDGLLGQNAAHLKNYPFNERPVDLLFLWRGDTSIEARDLIAHTIKPSRIVAMHIPPAELAKEIDPIRAAYPYSIIFKQSMERFSLPIEVDFHTLSGDYLGQPLPGATPQMFARGFVSTVAGNEHSAPSFSPDGNEVFWCSNRYTDKRLFISMTMQRENGRWSAPYISPFDMMPIFSPDGSRVYFYSRGPRGDAAQKRLPENDIWYTEKIGDNWSQWKCTNFLAQYPELKLAVMPSIARNGNIYFVGFNLGTQNNFGIYRAELINGEYAKPELLPQSINLPTFLNYAPFIAPDESFLLFSSNRTGSLDKWGDLYISRRLADGTWTEPISLGGSVNTRQQEVFPGLSPDGKYLFFCRDMPGRKNDVYWVDVATIPALQLQPSLTPKTK